MADAADLKRLRIYHRALSAHQSLLNEAAKTNSYVVNESAFPPIAEEIRLINQHFPDLLPYFRQSDYLLDNYPGKADLAKLRGYLASALVRLETELETAEDTAPVTEHRDFTFISDRSLRTILEHDYQEIQRAFLVQCFKSVIILSGGAIEAILLDLLQKTSANAFAAKSAPSKKPDLDSWVLNDLIKVAVECTLVTEGVERLSHSIRGYRNLIHPGNQIRNKLVIGTEEARIAIEVFEYRAPGSFIT
jgi:hypothetical protein